MGGYVYNSLGGVREWIGSIFLWGIHTVYLKRCDIHLPAVPIAGDAPLIAL
jgi:hypothetical protein